MVWGILNYTWFLWKLPRGITLSVLFSKLCGSNVYKSFSALSKTDARLELNIIFDHISGLKSRIIFFVFSDHPAAEKIASTILLHSVFSSWYFRCQINGLLCAVYFFCLSVRGTLQHGWKPFRCMEHFPYSCKLHLIYQSLFEHLWCAGFLTLTQRDIFYPAFAAGHRESRANRTPFSARTLSASALSMFSFFMMMVPNFYHCHHLCVFS